MGISAWVYQLMGIVTLVHLRKIFGERSKEKLKNVWVGPIREKKFDSRQESGIGGVLIPVGKSTFQL